MKVRHVILGAFYLNLLAVGATAETTVIRGGACERAPDTYLIAINSGAVLSVSPLAEGASGQSAVIVYRPRQARGWASQRLLARFDLEVDGANAAIPNLGVICHDRS